MRYLLLYWFCFVPFNNATFSVSDEVNLVFSFTQNKAIYENSIYGEPPQFAIWLEDPLTNEVKTVFVTYRTGHGDFEGKSAVPVALPAWIGAFRSETGRNDLPTPQNPVDMAVSGATQKTAEISKRAIVPRRSTLIYYIEVNVAGDFNQNFPSYQPDGIPDPEGNGQPSIVYRGTITANPNAKSTPELIGRTEQMFLSTEIIQDLKGIESARQLFNNIEVTCEYLPRNQHEAH